jgi:hypothetical protein
MQRLSTLPAMPSATCCHVSWSLPYPPQVALYAASASALGLSALACGATVIFTPGWTAVACGAGILRSFGHLQVLSFTRYLAADMPEPFKVGEVTLQVHPAVTVVVGVRHLLCSCCSMQTILKETLEPFVLHLACRNHRWPQTQLPGHGSTLCLPSPPHLLTACQQHSQTWRLPWPPLHPHLLRCVTGRSLTTRTHTVLFQVPALNKSFVDSQLILLLRLHLEPPLSDVCRLFPDLW